MKTVAKSLVASILAWQVRRLQNKNSFKVIAVAGSVGKTGTKLAIANVLKSKFKVQHQEGNYNHIVTAPLVFFGETTPSLFNPVAWLAIFWRNEKKLRRKYPYELVVLELGTDGPNQLQKFKSFLNAEIGILTAITPEHMEFFADLDGVAEEELKIADLSTLVLVNKDLTAQKYLDDLKQYLTYALNTDADYKLANINFTNQDCVFDVLAGGNKIFSDEHETISEPQLYSVLAAIAVAHKLGMDTPSIKAGLANIKPVPGRMQRLNGVNGSTIIDDTYNASPEAVKAALNTLYRLDAPQKIAVLGNMNELGGYSEEEHRKIGEYCDPKKLNLLLTLGPDANKYLAPAAEAKGCKVVAFEDPYTIGEYLKAIVKPGTIILAKGSQNGVFAEEAVKLLLADTKDQSKLVRQTPHWLHIKEKAFKK